MIINLGCFAVLRCAGNCESRIRSSLLENISGNISVDISENIRGCNRRIRNSSLCGELRVEDSQLLAVARAVKTVSPLVGCASRKDAAEGGPPDSGPSSCRCASHSSWYTSSCDTRIHSSSPTKSCERKVHSSIFSEELPPANSQLLHVEEQRSQDAQLFKE